ncbi:hypothetical protein BDV32DRAFT_133009 [Aspergillus pseudonomiae]|nr:hypothetical protein BDV32DRAFT_133009 [Aspergillus pseudonomiae]
MSKRIGISGEALALTLMWHLLVIWRGNTRDRVGLEEIQFVCFRSAWFTPSGSVP